jgi:hypothetical protein
MDKISDTNFDVNEYVTKTKHRDTVSDTRSLRDRKAPKLGHQSDKSTTHIHKQSREKTHLHSLTS